MRQLINAKAIQMMIYKGLQTILGWFWDCDFKDCDLAMLKLCQGVGPIWNTEEDSDEKLLEY